MLAYTSKIFLPLVQVAPWYPVSEQSQEKLPGLFMQLPPLLQGVPSHSLISGYIRESNISRENNMKGPGGTQR